jgi:Protein of unknown function (DUF1625).
MAYTETTTRSYGQRLGGSLKGIVTGFLMFIIGTGLLWWNEGRTVKTTRAIKEAQSIAMHVDNVSSVDPSLNGKLIHATAFADTKDSLYDNSFGVRELAIKLNRKVEYYQFVEKSHKETRDKVGGGEETITTYTYDKKWVDDPVNSGEFHDPSYQKKNFVLTTIESKEWLAENVTFGAYTLPRFIKDAIVGDKPAEIHLTQNEMLEWQKTMNQTDKDTISSAKKDSISMVHINNNIAYFGKSSQSPRIGDVRITFTKVLPSDISIIAKVSNNSFEQYIAKNGYSFSGVSMGTVSAENMFQQAHKNNTTTAWLYRAIGILLVVFGLRKIFDILPSLLKVLPILGKVVGAGLSLVCWILGLVWSLIIIALAWIFYRPILGISILALAIAGIVFLYNKSKKNTTDADNTQQNVSQDIQQQNNE